MSAHATGRTVGSARPRLFSRMQPMRLIRQQESRSLQGAALIALRPSFAQALEQPLLIVVKVVTCGSSWPLVIARMAVKPCVHGRSGKTRKNQRVGFDRFPSLFGVSSGNPQPRTGGGVQPISTSGPPARENSADVLHPGSSSGTGGRLTTAAAGCGPKAVPRGIGFSAPEPMA